MGLSINFHCVIQCVYGSMHSISGAVTTEGEGSGHFFRNDENTRSSSKGGGGRSKINWREFLRN